MQVGASLVSLLQCWNQEEKEDDTKTHYIGKSEPAWIQVQYSRQACAAIKPVSLSQAQCLLTCLQYWFSTIMFLPDPN